jgi:hypothetical protein
MTTENKHEERTKNKRLSLLQLLDCAHPKGERENYAPTSEFNGTTITAVQLRLPIPPEHPTQGRLQSQIRKSYCLWLQVVVSHHLIRVCAPTWSFLSRPDHESHHKTTSPTKLIPINNPHLKLRTPNSPTRDKKQPL